MARVSAAKQKLAFRLRVEGKPISQVAKECGLSRATVRRFERGWTDGDGTRHHGWNEDLARLQAESERAELEGALEVKRARIRTYNRLATQAMELIEKQFPSLTLKTVADAKIVFTEFRKLCQLIATELGENRGAGTHGEEG